MATVPIGRWGLRTPDGAEIPNVPLWMQRLATDLADVAKDNQGTLAARPVSTALNPGIAGRYYRSSDDGAIARDHGTGWQRIAPARLAGTFAARPAATTELEGVSYYSTDKGVEWLCTGGAWLFLRAEPIVSASRPAAPVDRQLWEYDASGIAVASGNTLQGAGVRWLLRYDLASTYWLCVGWQDAISYVATQQAVTGSVTPAPWGDCATVGPSLTVPAWTGASDWAVIGQAHLVPAVNQIRYNIGVAVGAAAPAADLVWGRQANVVTGDTVTIRGGGRIAAVAAGAELRLRYSSTNGVPQFGERKLFAHPIRVAG